MAIQTFNFRSSGSNPNPSPFNSLFAFIFGVVVLVVFGYLFFQLISLLYKFGVIFLVIALVVNYKVVLAYLTSIVDAFKTSVLGGLMHIGYLVIFYPFVFIWLILQGVFTKKVEELRNQVNNQYGSNNQTGAQNTLTDAEGYTPYEELKSEINKTKDKL